MSAQPLVPAVASVLLIDDDISAIRILQSILQDEVQEIRFTTQAEEGLQLAQEFPTDLILLDANMPGTSGIELLQRLKADPALNTIPVVFVTQQSDVDFEVQVLELGAADFITKPLEPALVRARIRTQLRLKALTDELWMVANHDALTGICNRRAFDDRAQREWRRCVRLQSSIALALLDVDCFKRYNDTEGHLAGDAVLRAVAQAVQDSARRPGDCVARFGGEEFVVVLPETGPEDASLVADRMRQAVESLGLPHPGNAGSAVVTVSAGIACRQLGPKDRATEPLAALKELVHAADVALYQAKHQGRNRCVSAIASS